MITWKPIKNYEGRYEISEEGEVKSLPKQYTDQYGHVHHLQERILKPTFRESWGGRYVFGLTDKNGKMKQHYQHILVADTFDRERPFKELPNEEWKATSITNLEVSNYGRLRKYGKRYNKTDFTYCRYKLLSPTDNGHGYLSIRKPHGGTAYVHRIVALSFLPNPYNLPEVNHIDGNKHNNCVSNLEWVSRSENIRHALKLGLAPSGAKSKRAKLTAQQARDLKRKYWQGVSTTQLMKEYGITRHPVLKIAYGISYRKETMNN